MTDQDKISIKKLNEEIDKLIEQYTMQAGDSYEKVLALEKLKEVIKELPSDSQNEKNKEP